jgi:hypothetical protein
LCEGKSGLLSAPVSELFIQPDFRPQPVRHPSSDALTVHPERGQYAIGFFLDDLYPADTREIDPFAAGDVLRQRLEVTLHGFANERFGEITSLSRDVGNTLGVIHSTSPDLSVSN